MRVTYLQSNKVLKIHLVVLICSGIKKNPGPNIFISYFCLQLAAHPQRRKFGVLASVTGTDFSDSEAKLHHDE